MDLEVVLVFRLAVKVVVMYVVTIIYENAH